MTSLERVLAAIGGEPFDRYPFLNPYPGFSMMPHWPTLVGLTWLHGQYGSDAERLAFGRALNEVIGLDWVPAYTFGGGPAGQDRRYKIRLDDGVPVLIDLEAGDETRYEELPRDLPRATPQYTSSAEVEAGPAPPTADDMLAAGSLDFTRAAVAELGEAVFLLGGVGGAFSHAFRALTFEGLDYNRSPASPAPSQPVSRIQRRAGRLRRSRTVIVEGLYEAIMDDPGMVHALAERAVEWNVSHIRASARVGVHGMRVNEYPCGGELLSDEHFREFVLPYLKRTVEAVRETGMVVILCYERLDGTACRADFEIGCTRRLVQPLVKATCARCSARQSASSATAGSFRSSNRAPRTSGGPTRSSRPAASASSDASPSAPAAPPPGTPGPRD